jgi:hypothetical protein
MAKRWRSATTVGTAPRERRHAAKRSTSSATMASARPISTTGSGSPHDGLEIVDVVEEHLLDLADRRLDIARHVMS